MRNKFCEICNKQLNNFYSKRCLQHRVRPTGMKYTKHKENPTSFSKGYIPWNKNMDGYHAGEKHYRYGKHISEETSKKISATKQGISIEKWDGFRSSQDYLERRKFHQTMQKLVFERDNYTCQMCESKKDLQVDHIQPWSEYVELRFSMENCRTLCAKCHYFITFGKPMPKTLKGWGHNIMKKGGD